MDYRYKSIVVKNDSTSVVTLHIYLSSDPVCWVSYTSHIIQPGDSYLHRSSKRFQYQLFCKKVGKPSTGRVKHSVKAWTGDKLITVTNEQSVFDADLIDYPHELRVSLRRTNMAEESKNGSGRNLYEILNLDIRDVRKLKKDEQDRVIHSAFKKQIRRWHPDRPDGDDHIACEIIFAYDVLRDREKRAQYHNEFDYDRGWLSVGRWKTVFWPECESETQKVAYRKRLVQMMLSTGFFIGGVVLSSLTAGSGIPLMYAGGICGGALAGGAMQSGLLTIKKDSIKTGCSWKKYGASFGIGAVAGAGTAGAAVGITHATTLLQPALMKSIVIGSASSSVGGFLYSVANDVERKYIGNEKVTLTQFLGHGLAGVVIGAVSGTLFGLVTGRLNGAALESTAANVEGQLPQLSASRRFLTYAGKRLAGTLANEGTEAVLESTSYFLEERLDDERENRPPTDHLVDLALNCTTKVVKRACISVAQETVSHIMNEHSLKGQIQDGDQDNSQAEQTERENQTCFSDQDISLTEQDIRKRKNQARYQMEKEKKVKWNDMASSTNRSFPQNERQDRYSSAQDLPEDGLGDKTVEDFRICYISNGSWISRMVVKYCQNGLVITKYSSWNGDSISVPRDCSHIKVTFQALRLPFVWCDVKRWNRYSQTWSDHVHIFRYPQPLVKRTFTIEGSLYYEKVTKVTNEMCDEVSDV